MARREGGGGRHRRKPSVLGGRGERQTPGALGRVGLRGKEVSERRAAGANKNPWKERQGVRKRTHPQAGEERPKKELRAR